MEVIREWAFTICAVAIGSVFCVFLIPEGKLKKTAQSAIALVFLLTMVSVFNDNRLPEIEDVVNFENDDYPEDINVADYYIDYAETVIIDDVTDLLNRICLNDFAVEVVLTEISQHEISLDGITVYVNDIDSDKTDQIRDSVFSYSGILPEVVIEN